jgi:hypothetical protein
MEIETNDDSNFDTDLDDEETGICLFYFKGWQQFLDVLLPVDNTDYLIPNF